MDKSLVCGVPYKSLEFGIMADTILFAGARSDHVLKRGRSWGGYPEGHKGSRHVKHTCLIFYSSWEHKSQHEHRAVLKKT